MFLSVGKDLDYRELLVRRGPAAGRWEKRQIFMNIAESAAGSGCHPDRYKLAMSAPRGRVCMWRTEAKEAVRLSKANRKASFPQVQLRYRSHGWGSACRWGDRWGSDEGALCH